MPPDLQSICCTRPHHQSNLPALSYVAITTFVLISSIGVAIVSGDSVGGSAAGAADAAVSEAAGPVPVPVAAAPGARPAGPVAATPDARPAAAGAGGRAAEARSRSRSSLACLAAAVIFSRRDVGTANWRTSCLSASPMRDASRKDADSC